MSTSEQLRVTNQQVNTEKARFFDAQAQADWAAPDYTPPGTGQDSRGLPFTALTCGPDRP